MHKTKKIILFIILILFCKEEKKELMFSIYDSSKLAVSKWKIVPSNNKILVFDKNQKTYLFDGDIKKEVFLLEDLRGMRVQENLADQTPIGYFLFTQKSNNVWGGVFNNEIVRLERETSLPESILE